MRINKKIIIVALVLIFLLIGALAFRATQNGGKLCYGEGDGTTGYQAAGTVLSCCPGLKSLNISSCANQDCSLVGMTEGFVCAKCGDRICGKGENETNCPEDCAKKINIAPDNPNKSVTQTQCRKESESLKPELGEQCCAGLSMIGAPDLIIAFQKAHSAQGKADSSFVCAKCGNGQCDGFETFDNCPQDCKVKPACAKIGETVFYSSGLGPVKCCDKDATIQVASSSGGMVKIMTGKCAKRSDNIVCGNGVCDVMESSANCLRDCACVTVGGTIVFNTAVAGGHYCCEGLKAVSASIRLDAQGHCQKIPKQDTNVCSCGDGVCDDVENKCNCPQDCGSVAPVCGNDICESGENEQNCSTDCSLAHPN